jgi:hypothetical protein
MKNVYGQSLRGQLTWWTECIFLLKILELAAVLLGRGLICSYAELRIRITLERIRILIKGMRICDHWSIDHLGLHLSLHASIVSVHDPRCLRFEPLKLLKFDWNADPDPSFHFNADPDFHFTADPDLASPIITW